MVVIYAEKHSLAKTIAEALNAGSRITHPKFPMIAHWELSFNGEACVIVHGSGHLVELVPAKVYNDKFKIWSLNEYPCIPEAFIKQEKEASKTCFEYVKSFFDKADWIINATDPDREGELIFAYIYEMMQCKKPWKRVLLEDLTENKIKSAFNNLVGSDKMIPLQQSGRARDIADWLTGCNLTVAMTCKFGSKDNLLSVGRVQTPTLALVVNREKEIQNFIMSPYWKLTGTFAAEGQSFEAEYSDGNFTDKNTANNVLSSCNGKQGVVMDKTINNKTENAPLLYNATQLQIACSKKFSWSADRTANVMQSLYEKKYMTYPRTSSEHLTDAMQPEVTETLLKLFSSAGYIQYSLPQTEWKEYTPRHFNDSKVGSHPAIIPTLKIPDMQALSEDEKLLYDLLAKSIIRIVYPKVEIEETSVEISVDENLFKASGNVIVNPGWYNVDAMPEKKKKELPVITENASYDGVYTINEGVTEPPKRYTEADLLAAMELAGQKIENEEARTLMKLQKKGLGTDATRAPILKNLFDKEYLKKKGKSIIPSDKGIYLIDTLPVETLKSADSTGDLEKQLNDISLGKESFDKFINEIKNNSQEYFNLIASSNQEKFVSKENQLLCPFCKKPMRKLAWGYSCSGYSKEAAEGSCNFSINNKICDKALTDSQVEMLLSSGKTKIIKGFTSKKNTKFDAVLKLNMDTRKIEFEFPKK